MDNPDRKMSGFFFVYGPLGGNLSGDRIQFRQEYKTAPKDVRFGIFGMLIFNKKVTKSYTHNRFFGGIRINRYSKFFKISYLKVKLGNNRVKDYNSNCAGPLKCSIIILNKKYVTYFYPFVTAL